MTWRLMSLCWLILLKNDIYTYALKMEEVGVNALEGNEHEEDYRAQDYQL